MATTCQTIVTRAQAMSPLNSALTTDRGEMLSRIRADQQALFTQMARLARGRFETAESITSSSGTSGRTIALTALSQPVERLLQLTLATGEVVSQVDVLDTDAELAPRYYVQGTTLYEVGNDWSTASGTVTMTCTYVTGASAIDPDGALTQTVSVPDEWIDLLVLPLALYLFQKDPGRDPQEGARLAGWLDQRTTAWEAYLTQYAGVETQRFILPQAGESGKK